MTRTRIKFCGITRPQDAVAAADAGADAIGLIFYPKSARYVTVERAQDILAALPPMVTPVALFVDASPSVIVEITDCLHIRTVQLHGNETPGDLLKLPAHLTVVKAIHTTAANLETLHAWPNVSGFLLETASKTEPGGTGQANDWALVESYITAGNKLSCLIAAGGLTPENVGEVIRRIRPWAVDVSTGIEESPGIKSVEKMQRFTDAVIAADRQ